MAVVRLVRTGERATTCTSDGWTDCLMCQSVIKRGDKYTRHRAVVPENPYTQKKELICYNMCSYHAPFRKETPIERLQASGEIPKLDIAQLPTRHLPTYKPAGTPVHIQGANHRQSILSRLKEILQHGL